MTPPPVMGCSSVKRDVAGLAAAIGSECIAYIVTASVANAAARDGQAARVPKSGPSTSRSRRAVGTLLWQSLTEQLAARPCSCPSCDYAAHEPVRRSVAWRLPLPGCDPRAQHLFAPRRDS